MCLIEKIWLLDELHAGPSRTGLLVSPVSVNPQCILNKESLSRSAYKTRVLLIGMKMCPEACRTLTLFSPRSRGAVFVETQQTGTTRNNEI